MVGQLLVLCQSRKKLKMRAASGVPAFRCRQTSKADRRRSPLKACFGTIFYRCCVTHETGLENIPRAQTPVVLETNSVFCFRWYDEKYRDSQNYCVAFFLTFSFLSSLVRREVVMGLCCA